MCNLRIGGSNYYCTSCSADETTLSSHKAVGECFCKAGYVPQTGVPATNCQLCAPVGCPYCIGASEAECMSPEQANFVYSAKLKSLPIQTMTTDSRICFNDILPTLECTPSMIEAVTGSAMTYPEPGVAKLSPLQCYSLLTAHWPHVTYAFNLLFPDFVGPGNLLDTVLRDIKMLLVTFILQFGHQEMSTWTDLKAAWNAPEANWKNYMAWLGPTPGYSLDAGLNKKDFPSTLLSWLQYGCTSTSDCFELKKLFNNYSTACSLPCSEPVRSYCQLINSSSPCGSSTY